MPVWPDWASVEVVVVVDAWVLLAMLFCHCSRLALKAPAPDCVPVAVADGSTPFGQDQGGVAAALIDIG